MVKGRLRGKDAADQAKITMRNRSEFASTCFAGTEATNLARAMPSAAGQFSSLVLYSFKAHHFLRNLLVIEARAHRVRQPIEAL